MSKFSIERMPAEEHHFPDEYGEALVSYYEGKPVMFLFENGFKEALHWDGDDVKVWMQIDLGGNVVTKNLDED